MYYKQQYYRPLFLWLIEEKRRILAERGASSVRCKQLLKAINLIWFLLYHSIDLPLAFRTYHRLFL